MGDPWGKRGGEKPGSRPTSAPDGDWQHLPMFPASAMKLFLRGSSVSLGIRPWFQIIPGGPGTRTTVTLLSLFVPLARGLRDKLAVLWLLNSSVTPIKLPLQRLAWLLPFDWTLTKDSECMCCTFLKIGLSWHNLHTYNP